MINWMIRQGRYAEEPSQVEGKLPASHRAASPGQFACLVLAGLIPGLSRRQSMG
jgi:hypothetical protein